MSEPTPDQALLDLFLSLQGDDGDRLVRFIRFGAQGEAIAAELPGGDASAVKTAACAVDLLKRRGLIDGALFDRMEAEFPRRAEVVRTVRRRWEGVPAPGRAGPGDVYNHRPTVAMGDHERLAAREMLASRVLSRADVPQTLEISLGDRYTELEAEVEAVGAYVSQRGRRMRGSQTRFEQSLTKAIERNREPIVLLEGEPGSGKTVSLHRVEHLFADQIRREPECPLPVPLCVKLKYVAAAGGPPSARLRSCVMRAIDPNPAVAEDLFDLGARCGGWLLLLDGFDEIPGVLSAIEVNAEIKEYVQAIHDLCYDIGRGPGRACQIIVAARHYNGPTGLWRGRFRIRPLSPERQREFIVNFGLDAGQAVRLVERLSTERLEIQGWMDNPLTLAMLCEVVRADHALPENLHHLFERYLKLRFDRDAGRIRELYGNVARLREAAENIGFVMAVEPGLGIAPENGALRAALSRHGFPTEDLVRAIEAIDELKLLIHEERGQERRVGFRHRRLQEYFATCVLRREPERSPSPQSLLFEAPWREAAVVILQQASDLRVLTPLLECAEATLTECHAILGIPVLDIDPRLPAHEAIDWTLGRLREPGEPRLIHWPNRGYHLLDLLQAGFAYRHDLPRTLQRTCVSLLIQIYQAGTRIDKKRVLEVVGVLPPGFLEGFALSALDGNSELLQDLAFRQLPRLEGVSAVTRQRVSRLLYRMARSGKIIQERTATHARIRRINDPGLEEVLELACVAVARDRRIRLVLIGIYALLVGSAFLAVLDASTAIPFIVVIMLLPVLALAIRDTANNGMMFIRYFLDLFTFTIVMAFAAGLAKALGLGLVGAFLLPALWIYALVWAPCALVTVFLQMSVSRKEWPFLPLVILSRILRQPRAALAIVLAIVVVSGVGWKLADVTWEPPQWFGVVLAVPTFGALALACYVLGRRGVLYVRDRLTAGSVLKPKRLTAATLRADLAALRTSDARIRLLRDVLAGGRLVRGVETCEDLAVWLVALESHLRAVRHKGGVIRLLRPRLRFAPGYVARCTTEHQRWCLEHCGTLEAIADLTTVIDLLTMLLADAEDAARGSIAPPREHRVNPSRSNA